MIQYRKGMIIVQSDELTRVQQHKKKDQQREVHYSVAGENIQQIHGTRTRRYQRGLIIVSSIEQPTPILEYICHTRTREKSIPYPQRTARTTSKRKVAQP
jgi:hypothetical protein